jgi:caa(3)-type oxidase subunit IV
MNDPTDSKAGAFPKAPYLAIYVAILALIGAQVGVSMSSIQGNAALILNLLIAGVQTCLLAYFFMHLKGADNMIWLTVGAAVFWILLMFLLLLTDYVTRQFAAY